MIVRTGLDFVRTARRVCEELAQRHRFAHVLRTTRLAARLARAHGEDPLRAATAGLLHDLARLYSGPRLIEECEARHLAIEAFERANPVVLHARLGAELARERYGVTDEAVLSAIRKHTVGAAEMSALDAIVYLADSLEPERDYAERAGLEALAFQNLDRAMLAVLRSGIAYLQLRALTAAPETLAALSAFELRLKKLVDSRPSMGSLDTSTSCASEKQSA